MEENGRGGKKKVKIWNQEESKISLESRTLSFVQLSDVLCSYPCTLHTNDNRLQSVHQ